MNAIQQLQLRKRRLARGGKLGTWADRLRISQGSLSLLERGAVKRVDYRVFERVKRLYCVSDEEVRQALCLAGED